MAAIVEEQYIGIKEDGAKIRIWQGNISALPYATVFRYTVVPSEDKINVRQLQLVFVKNNNRNNVMSILHKYLADQSELHNDPTFMRDVRDKILDDLAGYMGISHAICKNYDNVPCIIVELNTDNSINPGSSYTVIRHTSLGTLSKSSLDILHEIQDPVFSINNLPFSQLSE